MAGIVVAGMKDTQRTLFPAEVAGPLFGGDEFEPRPFATYHKGAGATEREAAFFDGARRHEVCKTGLHFIRGTWPGGITDHEGQERFGYSWPKRRVELLHAGLVEPLDGKDSRPELSRPSPRGRPMRVWRST